MRVQRIILHPSKMALPDIGPELMHHEGERPERTCPTAWSETPMRESRSMLPSKLSACATAAVSARLSMVKRRWGISGISDSGSSRGSGGCPDARRREDEEAMAPRSVPRAFFIRSDTDVIWATLPPAMMRASTSVPARSRVVG